MTATYSAAFTPGTLQNRTRQAQAYLSFMITYSLDYLQPSHTDILLYAQCLANSYSNPATHKNYLSGAKTFVTQAGGSIAAFTSPLLQNFLKGVARLSTHQSNPAPAIPLSYIKATCDLLTAMPPDALTVRAALLMGFCSFLRQSNLLWTSGYTSAHALTRADITDDGDTLWLSMNSSKTIADPRLRVAVPVPVIGNQYCPVQPWRAYVARVPLPPDYPAFMLDAFRPLTPAVMNSYLRSTLSRLSFPMANQVTVHSLRRSGAKECARHGAQQDQVMRHGTWTSTAIYAYVPKRLFTSVPKTLIQMFGQ